MSMKKLLKDYDMHSLKQQTFEQVNLVQTECLDGKL